MEGTRIFRYQLQDAWGETLTQVDVVDCEQNNVRCLRMDGFRYLPPQKLSSADGFATTLSRQDIDEIKRVYREHMEIFQFVTVESPAVIDGVINFFEFCMEDKEEKKNTIEAFNLWAFKDPKNRGWDGKVPQKAYKILVVYH
ncbi:MAG: hypothetical protein LUC47_02850, partial [Clostridiales bacterium]|nr:hypothetical protein [Clostridiales bacterium]